MVLTRADDFPIHQTPEPIAYAGTDRNFYDRYFFNGYAPDAGDERFFAAALGVYPHLNIIDAAFSVLTSKGQVSVHASRWLDMERMDLSVGPISVEVVRPLEALRLKVDAGDLGLRADLLFTARSAPVEEPRFIRRIGPRTFMDYTRLTQNGRYSGSIECDGVAWSANGFVGTRDRSWGVRPVGARDPQEAVPPAPPQFFWLWSPCNFEDFSLFFHVNDDAHGRPWNTRAVQIADGAAQGGGVEFETPRAEVTWARGTRNAASARVLLDAADPDAGAAVFTPTRTFHMLGIGYGHPRFSHGLNRGALSVEKEEIAASAFDPKAPHHLHVQALSEVEFTDRSGRRRLGRGTFEQLALGPHAPSGLTGFLDPAT